MIDRVVAARRAGGCWRCRSGSSGSRRACSTARAASAARRARAPASCAATARSGPPTRTASILGLLAAEITARTGKDPGRALSRADGASSATPHYTRIDAPATPAAEGACSTSCRRRRSTATTLAGEPITAQLTSAPGNGAPIGGLKVATGRTAGSRPGRRAPRTSTRSTRRASRDGAPRASRARGARDRERRPYGFVAVASGPPG